MQKGCNLCKYLLSIQKDLFQFRDGIKLFQKQKPVLSYALASQLRLLFAYLLKYSNKRKKLLFQEINSWSVIWSNRSNGLGYMDTLFKNESIKQCLSECWLVGWRMINWIHRNNHEKGGKMFLDDDSGHLRSWKD